jgi:hypothetical protein
MSGYPLDEQHQNFQLQSNKILNIAITETNKNDLKTNNNNNNANSISSQFNIKKISQSNNNTNYSIKSSNSNLSKQIILESANNTFAQSTMAPFETKINNSLDSSNTSSAILNVTSNTYFSGYLMKWTNYIKGYQKRWFVLNNGLLSYFRLVLYFKNFL